MLTTIPLPLPDQTLLSLVALAWMENPLGSWSAAESALLGKWGFNTRGLAHSGVRHFFHVTESMGYERAEDLLARHCNLPLVKPFVHPSHYANCVRAMLGNNVTPLIGLSKHNMIRAQTMFCIECVDADHRKHGYAYARRAHQVVGVTVCHEHGQVLQALARECSDRYATRGILVAPCASHAPAWHFARPQVLGTAAWARRYATFVAASMAGELEMIASTTRRRSFEKRLQARHPKAELHSAALSQALQANVGGAALCAMNLDPRSGWSIHWPWWLLKGYRYYELSVLNLVTIATLYDSVDDYHRACKEPDVTGPLLKRPTTVNKDVPRHTTLPKSMIRDLLRETSLMRISEKQGMPLTQVEQCLRSYPALDERRPAALERRLTRMARLDLHRFMSNYPNPNQNSFKRHNVRAYNRLVRFDRAWFDSVLPSGREPTMAVHDLHVALASNSTALTMQLLTDRNEHLRRTWKHLLSLLRPPLRRSLLLGHLPSTSAVVKSFVETRAQHIDRCSAHLQALLKRGDDLEAERWASRVAKSYPRYAGLLNEKLNGQNWVPPTTGPLKQQMARRRNGRTPA